MLYPVYSNEANMYQSLRVHVGLLPSRGVTGAHTRTRRLAKMAVVRKEM